jgi:glypican 4
VGCGQPKLGRNRRAYPLYNTNADLFIDDEQDEEDLKQRTKRAADPANQENRRNNQEVKTELYKFPRNENVAGNRGGNRARNQNRNNARGGYPSTGKVDNKESALDRLVKEIRQKVKDTKKFWSNLPYTACNNDDFAPAANSDNCWNGQTVNR